MKLQRLTLTGFRNFSGASVTFGPCLNWIIGSNGSGKTSILEAIHFLASGHSFRRGGTDSLRKAEEEETILFGQVVNGSEQRIGIRLSSSGREIRHNGEVVRGFGSVAGILKTVHFIPESHRLADGGPRERRRFMDWGLFHVEPSYLALARRYTRALQQRNRWLRKVPEGPDPWQEELARTGEAVADRRGEYVARLEPWAEQIYPQIGGFGLLGLELRRGWGSGQDLASALARDRARDRPGTGVGPHRGDLRLTLDGMPVQERASRGQQKLVVLALRLAQLALAQVETGDAPLFLLDDLGSELDEERRQAVFGLLEDYGEQIFVTATDPSVLPPTQGNLGTVAFHLQSGSIERSD